MQASRKLEADAKHSGTSSPPVPHTATSRGSFNVKSKEIRKGTHLFKRTDTPPYVFIFRVPVIMELQFRKAVYLFNTEHRQDRSHGDNTTGGTFEVAVRPIVASISRRRRTKVQRRRNYLTTLTLRRF
jgi:hypothetical protein